MNVIRKEHFERMKDGAIVCNSGHFNVEIEIPALEEMAISRRVIRDFLEEFTMADGRRIILLGEGRLINLAAEVTNVVMDMSLPSGTGSEFWSSRARGRRDVPCPELDNEISASN
jgi:adenosylhomocysteinase